VPVFQGIRFQHLEPPPLFLPADVQPELDNHVAVVGQGVLKIHDVAVAFAPLLFRRHAFHPLDQHPAIPAPIKDGHLAIVGQLEPEAPQPGQALLKGARPLDRIELEAPGVQP